MLNSASVGSDIQITPAHRELVRQNGLIDVGPFLIQIDREFVRVEHRTSADLPSLIYFLRILEEVRRQHGNIYMLFLVSPQAGILSLENRRWAAEWDRQHGLNAVAIMVLHNPLYTIMLRLLLRAMSLIRRSEHPSAFFKTEEEARSWLDAERCGSQRGAA